jgi:ethanolamine utilization protein EutA
MFSKLFMQLLGEGRSVQSVLVGREILWQSPIFLTPYRDDRTIDAEALDSLLLEAYHEVGATARDVDTGVVILTGEALRRENAQAVANAVALGSGQFVCASAGHHMEAVLAANGSGTVARSRRDGSILLNVDIGGGTTKLALVRDGQILATAAVAIGARLIVRDGAGRLIRLDDAALRIADQLGMRLALGDILSTEDEAQIIEAWVAVLADLIEGRDMGAIGAGLLLTDPLPAWDQPPNALTFSGGVSEFIFMRETRDFGDLGKPLARAIRTALSDGRIKLPAIIDPDLGIRATAVGASLFTSQMGINIHISDESVLPLLNVPVLEPGIALESVGNIAKVAEMIGRAVDRAELQDVFQPIAIALRWPEEESVEAGSVKALAAGISEGMARLIASRVPVVVLVDETPASDLGRLLASEFGDGTLIYLEGVFASEFDFIDLAEVVHPTEVVPVSIKSLLFAGGLDRRSVKQALAAAKAATS